MPPSSVAGEQLPLLPTPSSAALDLSVPIRSYLLVNVLHNDFDGMLKFSQFILVTMEVLNFPLPHVYIPAPPEAVPLERKSPVPVFR